MKYLIILLFLFSSSTISAQIYPDAEEHRSVLKVGDELIFGNKSLRFKQVISDSRCPTSVNCIWEGEAHLLFELYENGKKQGETSFSTSVTFAGDQLAQLFPEEPIYLSKLVLAPYPRFPGEIPAEGYRVHLQVMEFPMLETKSLLKQHS